MIDFDSLTVCTFGANLGASPAELEFNPELDRPMSWHSHDGEAELRLNDTVYDS